MIDFHCHLDLFPDPFEVARICVERRVEVLSVTTTPTAWAGTRKLEGQSDGRIRTALGLHPELAEQRRHELKRFDELLPEAAYVGEIGLDRSRGTAGTWASQVAVFEHILDACAREGGRVMSIHSRGAVKEVLDRLEQSAASGVPVLHWFSGSLTDLERAVECGCWFSLGVPSLTGARARQFIERIPPDRILTESDAPFASVSGRQAQPWDVGRAEKALANLWGVPEQEVAQVLVANLERIDQRALIA